MVSFAEIVEFANRIGVHHDDDLVDTCVSAHGLQCVLDYCFARDLDQLLGDSKADPDADAAGQDNRNCSHSLSRWSL